MFGFESAESFLEWTTTEDPDNVAMVCAEISAALESIGGNQ